MGTNIPPNGNEPPSQWVQDIKYQIKQTDDYKKSINGQDPNADSSPSAPDSGTPPGPVPA